MRNLDTGLLKTFIEVAKTRHFGRAAENLYLTQSAVSFRIRQLEELLNVKLFERHRHNILLTAAGERLIPHAQGMLAMWQRTFEEVGLDEGQRTPLVLGAPANLWDAFLQKLIVRVICSSPDFSIRTVTETSAALSRGVLEHRIDLGLTLDPPKSDECQTLPAGVLSLQQVASTAGHDMQTAAGMSYVAMDWGTAFNLQLAKSMPQQQPAVLHTGQVHIALEYLLGVGGHAWLPRFLVEPLIESGQLHAVTDAPLIQRQVYMVYRQKNDKLEALNALAAQLREDETLPLQATGTDPA
ncbi:LysR family transcriptional regulator [Marinobacterium jannaschii]|uniref:LysR family transcriptional regulator n=1 Tax=Marinobacterium jannaschii TaxID=64970 RepID=UPI000684512F|nr:LysR family transcriptional regulator [Marinobacterium jannaschii]